MNECAHPGHPLVLIVEVKRLEPAPDLGAVRFGDGAMYVRVAGEAQIAQCRHCGRIGVSDGHGVRWAT